MLIYNNIIIFKYSILACNGVFSITVYIRILILLRHFVVTLAFNNLEIISIGDFYWPMSTGPHS